MTTLNLLSLTKTYTHPVVQDLSLDVASGEMLALLGPSGSGKSTILKMIAGIETPDAGDIRLDGKSVLTTPVNQRGAVLMFQKAYLFPFLNVSENIAFGLKTRRISPAKIRAEVGRMLDLIGLPGIEKRRPASLSGGEQQRVALARALVTQPRVLLLDEPLSSLDTAVRLLLQRTIHHIQRELGITTVIVTHDIGEAMAMSDRVALLLGGKLVAVDCPERLFQRPPSLAAAEFMGVTTFLHGRQHAGRLETSLGALQLACAAQKSCEAVFAIRPEHVCIRQNAGENTLPGEVVGCVFRGEYIEYRVAAGTMTVRAHVPMPATAFPPGAQVHLHFPPAHLFAVEA